MKAVLTDVEGTTSAVGFVKDTLFPFARQRLPGYLVAHAGDPQVAALIAEAAALAGVPAADLAAVGAALVSWIDADRKVAPLKALQGRAWAEGYAAGLFRGHVYPDVAPALRRWHTAGVGLYVFSSGSVEAQRLLFAHAEEGDLSGLFSGHFDTRTGAKTDPAAYRAIAAAIGQPAPAVLFLSDAAAELAAARAEGFAVAQVCRAGLVADGGYPSVTSFAELG